MDQQKLLQLLSESTARLTSLQAELGHPPQRLKEAIAALHTTLHVAIEGQLDQVQTEVNTAKKTLEQTSKSICDLKSALGDSEVAKNGLDQPKARDSQAGIMHGDEALLTRVARAREELNRLQGLYNSRRQQADKLSTELASFEPILGDYVPRIRAVSPPVMGKTTSDNNAVPPLSASYLTQLSSAIDKCGHELTRRSEELQLYLYEILGLWSELCLPPESDFSDSADVQPTFDDLILRHLRLQTAWEEVQLDEGGPTTLEFQGTFLPVEPDAGHDDGLHPDTPSRPGGSSSSKLQSMRTAETHFPPHVLQPTRENIAKAQAKRDWLETEKNRREGRIQELYDELFSLWVRFDVSEKDMDKFVVGNSGSTMAVIEAYEAELGKMRELKQQHMALFVGKVRERVEELWLELRLGEEQRQVTFPNYFLPLDGLTGPELDDLLAQHEAKIFELQAEVETKAPLLKLVGRYLDLCKEEKQLEESAKDTSRLMKGVRGDPGRLLREEKMRKRVKIQKPKLEAELLKSIPAWEAEAGQNFTIDGEAYYGKILALSGAGGAKKRSRAASVATPVADGQNVLQHSVTHTNRAAATPLRTPSAAVGMNARSAAPSRANTASTKKPRLVTKGQAQVKTTTPSAANVGHLRSRMPPPTANANRLASSNRTPIASRSSKAHNSQFFGAKNAVAALARVSTSGYQAGHTFRPRPSELARAATGLFLGHGAEHASALPRNMSGASIASDATTLCYPGAAAGQVTAYAEAIPSRAGFAQMTAVGHTRVSVNQGKTRRGPSLSLENALASLAAAGYPRPRTSATGGISTIRAVSSQAAPVTSHSAAEFSEGGEGANWAVLEEDEGDDGRMVGIPFNGVQDNMEVF